MVIVGAFILPHGAMILDPKKKNIHEDAIKLHHSMLNIAKDVEKLKPEIIFLTTPHCIALSTDFGIYLNKGGKGNAEWNNEYSEFLVHVEFDQDNAKKLLSYLKEKKIAVSGIAAFAPSVEAPFRWGEVVPLWFLRNITTKPKYLVLSQPMRRYEQTRELIPEAETLGKYLQDFLNTLKERIIVIISADLSHTHSPDGPYGFNEIAKDFDVLIEQWAKTLDNNTLIKNTSQSLEKALCCGYIGFIILGSILEKLNFKAQIILRVNPTYYGMLIAKYILKY